MLGLGLTLTGLALMGRTEIQKAISVLRSFGTDAHVYLPGVGMLNGLQAGNYIDSAGTTVGIVDQPVGLDLDAMGGLGVELVTSVTGNAATLSAGNLTEDSTTANHGATFNCTTPANRTEFRFTAKAGTKSWIRAYFSGYIGGSAWFDLANGVVGAQEPGVAGTIQPLGGGLYECVLIKSNASASSACNIYAVASNGSTAAYLGTNSVSLKILSYSVREVTGIHATQPTTGSKPILRRGAVNLLSWSSDITQGSSWVSSAVTATTNLITPTVANTIHRVQHQTTNAAIGQPYTVALRLAPSGYRYAYLNGAASNNAGRACFDLQTGTVSITATGVATITPVGDGSYICAVSAVSAGTESSHYLQVNNSGMAMDTPFAGDGTSGIYCYASGLFNGTYTAAQIQALGGIPLTTTAPASTALGPYFWQFDGSNDSLQLSSVPWASSDDWWVVCAAARTSGAGEVAIFSVSGSPALLPDLVFGSDGLIKAYARNDAGTLKQATGTAYTLGTTKVVAVRCVAGVMYLRVNGINVGQVAIEAGSYTLTAASVGSIGGGGYFPGNVYYAECGKSTISEANLLLIEKYAAQAAGIQL